MKGEIVAYHQAATRAAEEAMENLFQCGRLLDAVKDVLKNEKTTPFAEWCERFCDISGSSAYSYCKLYQDLREFTKFQRAGIFNRYNSQRAVASFLADNRKTEEKEPPTMTETSPSYELPKPVRDFPALEPDMFDGVPVIDETGNEPKVVGCIANPRLDKSGEISGDVVIDEETVRSVPLWRNNEPVPFPAEPQDEPATVQKPETPGQHSPTPWYWDSDYIRDAEDNEVIATGEASSDDLNRIVACVNAMAGVSNPEAVVGTE
jgi:hypothetical protein